MMIVQVAMFNNLAQLTLAMFFHPKTYRTLPLIEPRPKVRRDYPTGSYLRHMDGPTWHEIPKTVVNTNPPKLQEVMNRVSPNA